MEFRSLILEFVAMALKRSASADASCETTGEAAQARQYVLGKPYVPCIEEVREIGNDQGHHWKPQPLQRIQTKSLRPELTIDFVQSSLKPERALHQIHNATPNVV